MEGSSRYRGILPWAFAATLMCGLFWTSIGLADISEPGQEGLAPSATGSLSPVKLPPTKPAPVTLAMQLSSPPVGGATRVMERIDFELSPRVTFGLHGLQSCEDDILYTPSVDARRACAGSLVGHGAVTSEIFSLHGPVTVTGRLLAFYSDYEGRPLIYGQVRTPEPVNLLYVIPFTIGRSESPGGTDLFVPSGKMRGIQGICTSKRPDCFQPPYDLESFYARISGLDLNLHRVYRSEGRRLSFVSATCAAPKRVVPDVYTLLKARLTYAAAGGEETTMPVKGSCMPDGP
jgi:hypothetical protein